MTVSLRPHVGLPAGNRRGMTLVELMASITIIALLSSMVLVGIAGAVQQAKEKRTQAQIAKLHELIMEKYRSYETRRAPIIGVRYEDRRPSDAMRITSRERLKAIRELMRLEMPDRINDVVLEEKDLRTLTRLPALTLSYQARVSSLPGGPGQWTRTHQGAECLYLIISHIYVEDATALRYFNDNEIGDVDNDGMPEILDAWGHPIEFLRWAPGFISPMQTPNAEDPSTLALPKTESGRVVTTFPPYISQTRDVFDPMGVDIDLDTGLPRNNFALVPLVMSPGPDGEFNLQSDAFSDSNTYFSYAQTDQAPFGSPLPNDPYVELPDADQDGVRNRIGQVSDTSDEGHVDNIYNHFLEAR